MRQFIKCKQVFMGATIFLSAFLSSIISATELGGFTGSPYDTWDGIKKAGIDVRTFKQANLLNGDEKVVRRYLQYVPRSIQRHHHGKKHPLVIVLPGADLSAEVGREWDWGDRIERLADKEKFILVYANAHAPSNLTDANPGNLFFANGGYWRTCFGRAGSGADFFTVDDVAYLKKIIAKVKHEGLPVDQQRVYLMGMSNGGEMVQRAAREMADVLAGVGAVMPVNSMPATVEFFTCAKQEQKPLSMMFIYSPKDTLLDRFYSNIGFNYGDVMKESINLWRESLGINPATEKISFLPNRIREGQHYAGSVPWAMASMNSTITRYDYKTTKAGANFAVLEINNAAGHAWPNKSSTPFDVAEQPYNGFKNQDIQAEEVLWSFLKKSKRK